MIQERVRRWGQGYRLVLQGRAFPRPVPIFAAWSSNNENSANILIGTLEVGDLEVIDALLGDELLSSGLFAYIYEKVGGWVQNS
jgi:hypothetical protein